MPGGRSFVPADLPVEQLGELAALVRPIVDRDRLGKGHGDGPLTAGRALIGRLLLALHRSGNGTVRTEHDVDELVTDDHGRVVGVVASTPAGRVRVRAHAAACCSRRAASSAAPRSAASTSCLAPPSGPWRRRGSNTGDAPARRWHSAPPPT